MLGLRHGCVPEALCGNLKPALPVFPGPRAYSGPTVACCLPEPLRLSTPRGKNLPSCVVLSLC